MNAPVTDRPFRIFLRLHWAQLRNTAQVLIDQSAIRLLSILAASILVWLFVYLISHSGFRWIASYPQRVPAFGGIVGLLFDIMFLALGAMLVFSTALILYSSLFASAEAWFLLATPARDDQIFAYKYVGAIAFSSWGFLLLGTPVLLAYGIVYNVNWAFYVFLPLFFLGFILLPGSLGALAALLVVNFIPKHGRQLVVVLGGALIILGAIWIYQAAVSARTVSDNRESISRFLGQIDSGQSFLMPTRWMTRGLQTAAQGYLLRTPRGTPAALYYLAMLWGNGLGFYLITAWAARRLYRRGFDRLATGGSLKKRYGGAWMDNLLSRSLAFLDPQTRLLIVKDFRTFRRDPAQWAQALIMTGLLALYFANIPNMFLTRPDFHYQNGISLLNMTTTGLLLCIYTGRFIFPMLSLEGRKFWVLGLLPLQRERLLWGKFAFAATGGLAVSLVLVLMSDLMLSMPLLPILLHLLTMAMLAIGLSGLSVGLGACMPNFRETDPSKIAAGFGGTLNLVVGLAYLIVITILIAGPWHVNAALTDSSEASPAALVGIGVASLIGVAVGFAAAWLPLKIGAQALRRMEF